MVNTQLLDEKIDASGLKVSFICDQLGISKQAFHKKKTGKTPFRGAEIYVLCDLLPINTDDEKKKIFCN